MTALAGKKVDRLEAAFEPTFLEALQPALDLIALYGIKVAVNASGSDTELLFDEVVKMIGSAKLSLKVAWIEGDDVFNVVRQEMELSDERFENMCIGESLRDWPFEPMAARAYLRGLGIAEALRNGADIVICGRVSDASQSSNWCCILVT